LGRIANREGRPELKLLVEPEDGTAPLVSAIKRAKKSIEIVIFRFDRKEVETALKEAVKRGIFVHALIASANRGGEEHLRQLEMRFLDAGITVARTANDLVRYHDKMLLIDRRTLYVLSFNYTAIDIEHSRSFAIMTRNQKFVQEAIKLFEADTARKPYSPGFDKFVVSPLNARVQLAAFIKKANRELLIYDPDIADPEMVRLLQDRSKAGVEVKVIGQFRARPNGIQVQKLATMRLHTRTIIRDRYQAFVGSQSLRKLELDARRELGLIVRDPGVVRRLITTFEADWTPQNRNHQKQLLPKDQKKAARVLAAELPPLEAQVKSAVKKVVARTGEEVFADKKVKQTVKKVVKKAFKQAMKELSDKTPVQAGPQ
jgi:cardiolipin synthase